MKNLIRAVVLARLLGIVPTLAYCIITVGAPTRRRRSISARTDAGWPIDLVTVPARTQKDAPGWRTKSTGSNVLYRQPSLP